MRAAKRPLAQGERIAKLERPAEVRFSPSLQAKGFSLQASTEANFTEQNEILRAEKARKDAAKFG